MAIPRNIFLEFDIQEKIISCNFNVNNKHKQCPLFQIFIKQRAKNVQPHDIVLNIFQADQYKILNVPDNNT